MGKKEETNPNHHMGKRTGYGLINGEYHLAPVYRQQFDELGAIRTGIDQMLESVTHHAAQELTLLGKQYDRLWQDVSDDIGFDLRVDKWVYSQGVISKKEN